MVYKTINALDLADNLHITLGPRGSCPRAGCSGCELHGHHQRSLKIEAATEQKMETVRTKGLLVAVIDVSQPPFQVCDAVG